MIGRLGTRIENHARRSHGLVQTVADEIEVSSQSAMRASSPPIRNQKVATVALSFLRYPLNSYLTR